MYVKRNPTVGNSDKTYFHNMSGFVLLLFFKLNRTMSMTRTFSGKQNLITDTGFFFRQQEGNQKSEAK